MDDLVFKNIPAEGFEPQTGFADRFPDTPPSRNGGSSDRFSNPTPSREGGIPETQQNETADRTFDSRLSDPTGKTNDNGTSFYDESTRLSNPTPSRRRGAATETVSASQPVPDPRSRLTAPTPPSADGGSATSQESYPSQTFDSRLSNPTGKTKDNSMSFYDEATRLSNPTPSRRRGPANETVSASQPVTDPFSRESNPTPTRRRVKDSPSPESAAPEIQRISSFPDSSPADDPYSRVSNPTPTRRRSAPMQSDGNSTLHEGTVNVENVRASNPTPRRRNNEVSFSAPLSGDEINLNRVEAEETFSRASTPTPTRKESAAYATPEISPVRAEAPSLSFASVSDQYGAGTTENYRASNTNATRRFFGSDEAPSDNDYDDSSRLSNISPSSRK